MRKIQTTIFLVVLLLKLSGQTWTSVGTFDWQVDAMYNDTSENILYVGGGFTKFNGNTVNCIIKYDGTSWTSMGGGMGSNCSVFAIDKYKGDIYAAGSFYLASGNFADCIAKWNGSSWEALSSSFYLGNHKIAALEVYNGELYVGGSFNKAEGSPYNQIARWNGSRWDSVGTGLTGVNLGIGELKAFNGYLYAGGNFSHAGGISSQSIARWNGTVWSNVSTGTNGTVTSFAELNGKLYVGGFFNHGCGDGCVTAGVCGWNGISWIDVGIGMNLGGATTVVGVYNDNIIAGGLFTTADSLPVDYLASWDGNKWSPFFAGGLNDAPECFETYNGELYVGGTFTVAGGNPATYLAKLSCPLVSLGFSVTDATLGLNDGAVKVNVSGGTSPYAYSLDSITFQASSTFTGLDTGTYQVYVTDNYGCTSQGTFIIGGTTVGLKDVTRLIGIKVFPNPFSDELIIELNKKSSIRIKLIDVLGRVILASQFDNTSTAILNVAQIPQGAYYLEVLNNKGEKLHTIMMQRKVG